MKNYKKILNSVLVSAILLSGCGTQITSNNTVKDIENAVKAIFKPMKGKFVTMVSVSDSLANIVANFSDVVEEQSNIKSAQLCRSVANSLLDIAWTKDGVKSKRKGKK